MPGGREALRIENVDQIEDAAEGESEHHVHADAGIDLVASDDPRLQDIAHDAVSREEDQDDSGQQGASDGGNVQHPAPRATRDRMVNPSWTEAMATPRRTCARPPSATTTPARKTRRDRDDENQRPGDVLQKRECDQQRDKAGEQETAVRRPCLIASHRRGPCTDGQARSARRAAPGRALVRRSSAAARCRVPRDSC